MNVFIATSQESKVFLQHASPDVILCGWLGSRHQRSTECQRLGLLLPDETPSALWQTPNFVPSFWNTFTIKTDHVVSSCWNTFTSNSDVHFVSQCLVKHLYYPLTDVHFVSACWNTFTPWRDPIHICLLKPFTTLEDRFGKDIAIILTFSYCVRLCLRDDVLRRDSRYASWSFLEVLSIRKS